MNKENYIKMFEMIAESALAKKPEDRTYEDRYNVWRYEQAKNQSNKYDEGEEVEIYDGIALSQNKIKDGFGDDFPDWFRECGKHFGKRVNVSGEEATLIGMSYTFVDYYYILDKNDKKIYSSCVEHIEYLE